MWYERKYRKTSSGPCITELVAKAAHFNMGYKMDKRSSQASVTILIVDDELFFRIMLRDILEKEGFSVVAEAANGVEAITKYRLHRPEITIMDIFMPEKNGIEALEEIVAMDRNARVLIFTGIGFDEDIEVAMQAGAKEVILKTFSPEEVTEVITRVMGEQYSSL
jgi:two-component system chemotaxis response regulator CheY